MKNFLGEAGKKMVYLAYDELLDRNVTFGLVKALGLDEAGRTRISREAQAMGRLGTRPHIGAVEHCMQRQVGINESGHV